MTEAVRMTEDELLEGITQALTFAGWRWTHPRRSDLAQTMGDPGLPDIIAVHPTRRLVLAWELKGSDGRPTGDQVAWISAMARPEVRVDSRLLYPVDYDRALELITGKVDAMVVCTVCGAPAVSLLDARTYSGLCAEHDDLNA